MKMRYNIFLYFLFFVISTNSDLIPNNRVITDPDSIKDFNLIEGITYNIVHLKSGSNLNSDGNDVYVSFEPSPYQYWSLRKAEDSQYNIINVESGKNLDSNGRNVYLGQPNIFNEYQHWVFTKIKNNLFNIVHMESQNLDSDGKNVYAGTPSHDNLYQQWSFEPSNYNLTAIVTDFEYPPDLKDNLDKYKTRTSLLSGNYIIENNSNATIEQSIDKKEVKINNYSLEIKKSESLTVTKNLGMSFSIGRSIFGLLGINTGFVNGIKREFSSKLEKVYKESVTETVSYHVRQKITVPPFNSVIVNSTVDKISINNVPFKAKILITGKADRLNKNGKVTSMTDVEANAIRCYLQNENLDVKNITVEGNSLIIDTSGTLRIDGYGLETKIETIEIPHKYPNDPNVPSDPNVPNDPNDPNVPNVPSDPNVPNDPKIPDIPSISFPVISIPYPIIAILFFAFILIKFLTPRFNRNEYLPI